MTLKISRLSLSVIIFTFVGVLAFGASHNTVYGAGVFKVSDYGSGDVTSGWFWRGYHFQVTEETVVTHMVGGGTEGGDFTVAIFGVDVPGENDEDYEYTITSIQASAIPPGDTPDQEVALDEPVTLMPGVDYMLAQGRIATGGSHHRVDQVDVNNLLLGSPRIDLWLPASGESINFGKVNPVGEMVGETAVNFNNTRPRVGFLFESIVAPSTVTTLQPTIDGNSVVLAGRIDETGGGITSQYLEFDTTDGFQSSTLRLLGSTGEDDTNFSTTESLSAGTYFYRAAGINEAGRTNGDTVSFTIHSLSYSAANNGSISGLTEQLVFDGDDGTAVTAEPNEGFNFVEWSDGSTDAERTDTVVDASLTLTASFATSTYDIVFSAGSGGSLVGTTTQLIEHGNTTESVEAIPDSGSSFVRWSDGSTENPRVLNNVTANQVLQAIFASQTARRSSGSVSNQVQVLESAGQSEDAQRLRDEYPSVFGEESEGQQTDVATQLQKLQQQLQSLLEEYRSMTGQDFDPARAEEQSGETIIRDLERDMEGEDVRSLQQLLNQSGFELAASGVGATGNETTYFGSLTENALIRYQEANSITPAIGYFGSITRGVMKTADLEGLWW